MTKIKLTVSCCLCPEKTEQEVELPTGWIVRGNWVDKEGFCPEHSPVADFVESQCPGCIEGWGECTLWRKIQARRKDEGPSITEMNAIRAGICPSRTNGTSMIVPGGSFEPVDISERASEESGEAFAQAIIDYRTKHYAEYLSD